MIAIENAACQHGFAVGSRAAFDAMAPHWRKAMKRPMIRGISTFPVRVRPVRGQINCRPMSGIVKGPLYGAGLLLLAIAAFGPSGPAFAAEYPSRPVRLIVPFPPGGAGDFQARVLGPKLGEQLRQQIVIDNRPGANGAIAFELVAKGSADGYTLLLGFMSALTMSPALYSKLPYDPAKDFAPISIVSRTTQALVANPSLPANSVKELVALAKAAPGKITFASPGIGNANHITGEMLKSLAGIDMVHVPYKGAGQAMTDLMGGQVAIAFVTVTAALPHVRAGKLKALVVTSSRRQNTMPEIPTVSEIGLPGLEHKGWFGVLASARTQKALISRLNKEIVKAVHSPEIQARFEGQGLEPETSTPEQFAELIRSELAKWSVTIKQLGIRAE